MTFIDSIKRLFSKKPAVALPVRYAVGIVIYDTVSSKALGIKRAIDDEYFPGMWCLPETMVRLSETPSQAVKRAALQKLGASVTAEQVAHGTLNREDHILDVQLFEARLDHGLPVVQKTDGSMTQYDEWDWVVADKLVPAARSGSLACQLFLRRIGKSWDKKTP